VYFYIIFVVVFLLACTEMSIVKIELIEKIGVGGGNSRRK